MGVKLEAILAELTEQTGNDAERLARDIAHYLFKTQGRTLAAPVEYLFEAVAWAVRDRVMPDWHATWQRLKRQPTRRLYYLSMEFLIGRSLAAIAFNLDLAEPLREALLVLGKEIEAIEEAERDAGLGNGGLGRLAACFLESAATLALPVMGYGLRYEYGMFRQAIRNGYQVEEPERWLRQPAFPWELERREYTRKIRFGGRTHHYIDPETGRFYVHWDHAEVVLAVPYDIPVPGYRNGVVNTLRLWSAQAPNEFNLDKFNEGDYFEAVDARIAAENLTLVLYPNDASVLGKELRLRQQYFLVAASLQDAVTQWLDHCGPEWHRFAELHCFQLNDTHPALAVAELMRILIDEHHFGWDEAWSLTTRVTAYTNHTLLPEALETWPGEMVRRILPRHWEIIVEIDRRFRFSIQLRWPDEPSRQERLAIVSGDRVRMAHLAVHGSFAVNGVSRLHTELLVTTLFTDFAELSPGKFTAITNGVTPRRWLALCNPGLRTLLDEAVGSGWVTDLDRLTALLPLSQDAAFRERFAAVKRGNKAKLAQQIAHEGGIEVDPAALFDVQVKRIHEYKRQLLNALHVIHLYDRIKHGETDAWTPRVVIFGGKAAPGYAFAKLIVKFLNNVAEVINKDPQTEGLLQVVFLPDYRVSAMEKIAPAADLSEQISTAGAEASGTGNMKLMMNGAITIGTYDGANIEILEAVGKAHFFRFGLLADEVQARRTDYDPVAIVQQDEALARVIGYLQREFFNPFEPGIFQPILDRLLSPNDPWLVLADFASYRAAQEAAAAHYRAPARWFESAVRNVAMSGRFSSDRTLIEYNQRIWHLAAIGEPARSAT
ncbi:glycogen/starch/alpha-glucan phosphorylase [Hydrogenophilus thiooxidans]|uniref:glycogen/starch/alpha-glucan phosphorylase n=1 Tax=Hydrogenophilus thiooxidans TaxID=2820326 RepID=UPI001C2486E6